MPTDTTERGLETLIMRAMTGSDGFEVADGTAEQVLGSYGPGGYHAGRPRDFERAYAIDARQLFTFLQATQPEAFARLKIVRLHDSQDIQRHKFLSRLSDEIGKRGVIEVLRKPFGYNSDEFSLFYGTPSEGNEKASQQYAQNRFTITRQLAYSLDETRRTLDLCLFINGLPIATFELKNSLTKQTVEDAVEQYRRDRDPREKLFEFGRCVVHFAVDDVEVMMCTELKAKASWFLPFNKGWKDGAGNPPNPNGLKTEYLWKEVLQPASLTNILEKYAQIVEEKDSKTGRRKRVQIFPRYHQLDVVRSLLADVSAHGPGKRYLIQHSAGSGKSNSIAWLAHQLISLRRDGRDIFDSVIVVTDRRILDDQLQRNIKHFMQVSSTVGHAERSGDLRKFIEQGKKIIVSTVQKFPFILDEINHETGRSFALIIDEAHSSQGGKTSGAVSAALGGDDGPDPEDQVHEALVKRADSRRLLKEASYFAFTATPKNKTLQLFGTPLPPDAAGRVPHEPFHRYTMKQAIEERFILDVLKSYTPVNSYYKLVKNVEDDPEFDVKRANKKLRRYVESHDHAIRLKAEIIVDHFHEKVLAAGKIGGEARAMVVCSSIERAIQYYEAIKVYLQERKSPLDAIVAFSGEPEYKGLKVTESGMNGFPSSEIAARFKGDPYRFLVCADKFQTGYDEPLLHTMYVDKPLSSIKAVQTLSRLNRAHPKKHDCFVLDFQNDVEIITAAFQDYYRTTILSEETDPNKLHDLKADLDAAHVYTRESVDHLVRLFLSGESRETLDPILDSCVDIYLSTLDEDQQVRFKGKAKAFCRTYDFLSTVLPWVNVGWEALSIFLNLLIPKLPAPIEVDPAKGILEAIDMDSYRAEKQSTMAVTLEDVNAEIEPIPVEAGGAKREPELEKLSRILDEFNQRFGTQFTDTDRVHRHIKDVSAKVSQDRTFQNAKKNTPHTARLAHDAAVERAMQAFVRDDTLFYKFFVENESFRRMILDTTYRENST